MPFYDFECPDCKSRRIDVLLPIAAPPPECPECKRLMHKVHLSKTAIVGDEIPGGMWLENYGPEPIKVYSHSEIRRLQRMPRVDKEGNTYYLTPFVRHVGVPGTDKSPHTTDWSKGSIDPYTLEAARILVSRQGGKAQDKEVEENDPNFRDPSVRHFNLAGSGEDVAQIMEIIRRG